MPIALPVLSLLGCLAECLSLLAQACCTVTEQFVYGGGLVLENAKAMV
jgi:hypothetical protein